MPSTLCWVQRQQTNVTSTTLRFASKRERTLDPSQAINCIGTLGRRTYFCEGALLDVSYSVMIG